MKMVNHSLTISWLLLIGLFQVILAVRYIHLTDLLCVPEDAYDACRQTKCAKAQAQGFDVDCDLTGPLTGGNQCCDLSRASELSERRRRQAYNFTSDPSRMWPIPIGYAFDASVSSSTYQTAILNALGHIEAQTCIDFVEVVPNATAVPFILFTYGTSCTAYVGRSDFLSTPITATTDCLSSMGEMLYYTVQTLGMWHESQRSDRDQYIMIDMNDTDPAHYADFLTLGPNLLVTYGLPYDYASIQHFPAKIYSNNDGFTILTRDPLYEQTIGQRVQLSFLDAKMLNLMYNCQNKCDPSQLLSTCQNGGYQNPNDCTSCKCPDGFAGQYCAQYETATGGVCGGSVSASPTQMLITSPGYFSPGYYDEQVACAWHITAPSGAKINLTFVDDFGLYEDPSYACYHWVEVRYAGAMNETGPRFCGQTLPQVQLFSAGSEAIIIFRSNLTGQPTNLRRGFKLAYQMVLSPVSTTFPTSFFPPITTPGMPPTSPPTPTSCNPNPCHQNGTCSSDANGVQCSCINGFTGQYCTDAPCGGCNISPGMIDEKCVIPEVPARTCQVTDYKTTCTGFWWWQSCKTIANTRSVACTWSVCCDNAQDLGCECGVLGWSDWGCCSTNCGGGVQIKTQYGFRADLLGHLFYTNVATQPQNCNTQKCACSGDDDGHYDHDKRRKRDRDEEHWCQTCNSPLFVESGGQCVPAS